MIKDRTKNKVKAITFSPSIINSIWVWLFWNYWILFKDFNICTMKFIKIMSETNIFKFIIRDYVNKDCED